MMMDMKFVTKGKWGDWYCQPLNFRVVLLKHIPMQTEDADWGDFSSSAFVPQKTPEVRCNPQEKELGNAELFESNVSMVWQEGASKQCLILGIGEYRKVHPFSIVNW